MLFTIDIRFLFQEVNLFRKTNMLFILSKLVNFFTSPINWIFIMLATAILIPRKGIKWSLLIAAIVFTLIFTNKQLITILLNRWSEPFQQTTPISQEYDIAIVLGGSVSYSQWWHQTDFNEHADRITEAIRLYRLGKVKKLYLLGESAFSNKKGISYAPQFKEYMQQMGVNQNDIILEQNSRTTRENIINLKQLFDDQNLQHIEALLITSGWHMRRALKGFKKAGFPVKDSADKIRITPYAVDVPSLPPKMEWSDFLPSWKAAQNWQMLIHEIIGLLII